MMYRTDGTAAFVGLEDHRADRWQKRQLRAPAHGLFEDGQAKESSSVVTGSATGELRISAARAPPRSVMRATIPSR